MTTSQAVGLQSRKLRPQPGAQAAASRAIPARPAILPFFMRLRAWRSGGAFRQPSDGAEDAKAGASEPAAGGVSFGDGAAMRQEAACPITGFDWEAIAWSMPPALGHIAAQHARSSGASRAPAPATSPLSGGGSTGGGGSAAPPPPASEYGLRIWTTQLCVCALLSMDESWLMDEHDDSFKNPTIVDVAQEWLARQAQGSAALAQAMAASMRSAQDTVSLWGYQQLLSAEATRQFEKKANRWFALNEFTRLCGKLLVSLFRDHDTMAAFTAAPADPLKRYQRVIVLFSTLLVGLATNVWLFWNRSTLCCAEARALLACDPDFTTPCREYAGDCANLLAQFEATPLPGVHIPDGYACDAFPDPSSQRDNAICALLLVALMLPMRLIIVRMFEMANEAEIPEQAREETPETHRVASRAAPLRGQCAAVMSDATPARPASDSP